MTTPAKKPRTLPGGRWTVLRFPAGAPEELVVPLVTEWAARESARRPPRKKWVGLIGEFFMNEGAPVLLLSPHLPAVFFDELAEFFELLGPVTITRSPREDLAFRGRVLFWLEDE